MRRLLALIVLVLCVMRATGQNLTDSFSDGDLTRDPAWQGDTEHFIDFAGELQLESPLATGGKSYLSTPCLLRDTAFWHINVRLNFRPSGVNQALYILSSDMADLNGAWSGWALRIGYNGLVDGLDLQRVRRGRVDTTVRWLPGSMINYPEVEVRLERTRSGLWNCLADTGLGGFIWAGSYQSPDPLDGNYVGIQCRYTSGNIQRAFFFDNLQAGPLFPDHDPPRCIASKAYPNRIRLDFDETLLNPVRTDFRLDPAGSVPDSVRLVGRSLWLYLPSPLMAGETYRLAVLHARDVSGNDTSFTIPIRYLLPAGPGTVVLSEIKPGSRALIPASPAAEFVELTNISRQTVRLDSLTLWDRAGSHATLPSDTLAPGGYALLHRSADAAYFNRVAHTVPCNLPALNDDGDSLVLISAAGEVLDAVGYSPERYEEPLDHLTRSLECRLDQRGCLPAHLLWLDSRSDTGSTPGLPNSVENMPAPTGIAVTDWSVPDAQRLTLQLNRQVEAGPSFQAVIRCLGQDDFNPGTIRLESVSASGLALAWDGHLLEYGKTYRLEMSGLQGCRPDQDTVALWFGLPRPADSGRICLNEIMFDPAEGGAEWIELKNPSETDWVSLEGASVGAWPGTLPDSLMLSGLFPPLAPGGIVWLSRSRRKAQNAHPSAPMENFAQAPLPELYSLEGDLSIRAAHGRIVEALHYARKLHHPLLAQTKGVSLERTSTALSTATEGAFASAARSSGFSTPGRPNSNEAGLYTGSEAFTAHPPAITPDLDGHNDYCTLTLSLPGTGNGPWFYTIRIYDAEGRPIRILAENLSGTGRVEHLWDGTDLNRARAPSGPYIALAEYFTLSGQKGRAKVGLAVAPW